MPLEALRLTTNFRSQAGIVDWVNATFPRLLPAAEDEILGAVPYSPSAAHHAALDGDAVCWHLFDERADEAQRVLDMAKFASTTYTPPGGPKDWHPEFESSD